MHVLVLVDYFRKASVYHRAVERRQNQNLTWCIYFQSPLLINRSLQAKHALELGCDLILDSPVHQSCHLTEWVELCSTLYYTTLVYRFGLSSSNNVCYYFGVAFKMTCLGILVTLKRTHACWLSSCQWKSFSLKN